MLADAQLQAEDQAFESLPRSQIVFTDQHLVRLRTKDLRACARLQQAHQEERWRGIHDLTLRACAPADLEQGPDQY